MALKICFLSDGRNLPQRSWMQSLVRSGHEIHLISTHPCLPGEPPVASLHVVPLDFSARIRGQMGGAGAKTHHGSPIIARLRGSLLWRVLAELKNRVTPLMIPRQAKKIRAIIDEIKPDFVHAMRIPFEGILAAEALRDSPLPLIMSVWGTDFTWLASKSPRIARLASRALARADALHPDCYRDLKLARELGFAADKPAAVLPGNGGVQMNHFHPGPPNPALIERLRIAPGTPVVINPRGVLPYIRNDTFFKAIPLVLKERPGVVFIGARMQGNAFAEGWVDRLSIRDSVRLLSFIPHAEIADFFRLATVTVSPSEHDGTPNSLIEAMACGTFPVAGDIESVREWIESGVNGLLCDPGDPSALAAAILRGLNDEALRSSAAEHNRRLIAERAEFDQVMAAAVQFYREVLDRHVQMQGTNSP